jgi:hypothetical protein
MHILDKLLGLAGLTRKGQATAPERSRAGVDYRKVAAYLNERGLKNIELPAAKVSVLFRKPRTLETMRAGLFPLRMTQMDLDKLSPEDREQQLKEADAAMVRLVCECSVEPKIVNRRNKKDEIRIDALDDNDFVKVGQELIEWIFAGKRSEPPHDPHPHFDDNMNALAGACKVFNIDPTEARYWDPERAEELIEMAMRTIKKDK